MEGYPELRCGDCGRKLNIVFNKRTGIINVQLCDFCVENKKTHWRDIGYDEGYDCCKADYDLEE